MRLAKLDFVLIDSSHSIKLRASAYLRQAHLARQVSPLSNAPHCCGRNDKSGCALVGMTGQVLLETLSYKPIVGVFYHKEQGLSVEFLREKTGRDGH